jgi:hypothetical protein
MINYNNIQHIFGDPLNDFGQSEKQGIPILLKAGLFLLVIGAAGYFYNKYLEEQYEKKRWVE